MTRAADGPPSEHGRAPAGPWSVRDVMTSSVVAVDAATPYQEVVETLAGHAVSAVPVIDADRRVLGVVSSADLLNKLEFAGLEAHRHLLEGRRRRAGRAKANADTAGDLMTEPAVVAYPNTSIGAAARLMDQKRVKRLPVVDRGGRLIGIVSRTDLLRVFRRSDDELRDEVVGPVLHRTLGITPGALDVQVAHGVVSLAGAVDRLSTIAIAVRLVRGVPGVVDVLDHLSYHYDDRPKHHDRQ